MKRFTWARRLTALFLLMILAWGDPWFVGSYNATEAFGWLPFTDPLAALEIFLASNLFNFSLFLGALILVLFCLFMGPVFCGWLCPLGLTLDLCARKKNKSLPRLSRFFLLGFTLGFSLLFGLPLFQALSPIHFMSWLFGYAHEIQTASLMLVFLVLIIVFEIFLPRFWCRSLCPLGGLYSLVGQKAPFGVKVEVTKACKESCFRCDQVCPMGIQEIRKEAFLDHMDCTRCGACVDVCPQKRLHLGFRGKK
jgi:ferredoxin-type protein NapH